MAPVLGACGERLLPAPAPVPLKAGSETSRPDAKHPWRATMPESLVPDSAYGLAGPESASPAAGASAPDGAQAPAPLPEPVAVAWALWRTLQEPPRPLPTSPPDFQAFQARVRALLAQSDQQLVLGRFPVPTGAAARELYAAEFVRFLDGANLDLDLRTPPWAYRALGLEAFKRLPPDVQQGYILITSVEDLPERLAAGARLVLLARPSHPEALLLALVASPRSRLPGAERSPLPGAESPPPAGAAARIVALHAVALRPPTPAIPAPGTRAAPASDNAPAADNTASTGENAPAATNP